MSSPSSQASGSATGRKRSSSTPAGGAVAGNSKVPVAPVATDCSISRAGRLGDSQADVAIALARSRGPSVPSTIGLAPVRVHVAAPMLTARTTSHSDCPGVSCWRSSGRALLASA